MWIGLTDGASKETSSGPAASLSCHLTFWAPNEPNNDQNDGNYVHMPETGHWNDERNMRKFFAVAEEDPSQQQTSGITKWLWLLLVLPLAFALAMLQRARSAQRRNGAPRRH